MQYMPNMHYGPNKPIIITNKRMIRGHFWSPRWYLLLKSICMVALVIILLKRKPGSCRVVKSVESDTVLLH